MSDDKAHTHSAYTRKRSGNRQVIWLEIGRGRLDADQAFHGLLDRVPIGGFDGYVYFAPIGTLPPNPEPKPQHPSLAAEDQED
jgi:hypothetical protein